MVRRKTKAVKEVKIYGFRLIGPKLPLDSDGNCTCWEYPEPHAPHAPAGAEDRRRVDPRATIKLDAEPRLDWEKQSYKRYSAIVPGANAHIEVLRSGRAGKMNERWHPAVFGNRWAGPGDGFATVVEAMVFAETTTIAYARSVLEALG